MTNEPITWRVASGGTNGVVPAASMGSRERKKMTDNGVASAEWLNDVHSGGFVEVMFAKSQHEASDLRHLLTERNIPVRLEKNPEAISRSGIAVLVPAARLVEASELLIDLDQSEEEEFDDTGDEDDECEDEDDYEDDDSDDDCEDEEYEDLEEDDGV